jgi:O-antigen/teichoic acid export membrane protein
MVPAAAAGWLLGPTLVRVFFGAEYEPAGEPFQLLLVSLAVLAWRAPLSMAFIASGREWTYLGVILAVTAVKTAACALLVPLAGTAGAAGAAIVAELAFAAGSVLCLRVVGAGSLVRPLFGPLLAGVAAAAAFLAVRNTGAGAAWAAALLTYALMAWTLIGRRALTLLRRHPPVPPRSEDLRPGRSGPPTAS